MDEPVLCAPLVSNHACLQKRIHGFTRHGFTLLPWFRMRGTV
jgi:hypothetical protein